MNVPAKELSARSLRIRRVKGKLIYTHKGQEITQQEFEEILNEPRPAERPV